MAIPKTVSAPPATTEDSTPPEATSTATFDLSDDAIGSVLTDCKVGEPEELMITFTPTSVDDTTVTGTISNVEYNQDEEKPEEEMPPESMGGSPAALNIKKTASSGGSY